MSLILAVDPGLANTGIVLMGPGMIYAAATLKTSRDKERPEFEDAVERSLKIARELRAFTSAHAPNGVSCAVVESYRDIPGHLRQVRGRWTTPLCIGLLIPALTDIADEIVWQDPETVMRASREPIAMWSARKSIYLGDACLTNEHTRSAAAHGLYYLGRAAWNR